MAARRSTRRNPRRRRPAKRDVPAAVWFLAAVAIIGLALWWPTDPSTPPQAASEAEPTSRITPTEMETRTVPPAEAVPDSTPTIPPHAPVEEPAPQPIIAAPPVNAAVPSLLPDEQRQILALQLALVRHGISPGPLDGKMGSQTRSAIRAFQFQQMIEATGEPDEPTLLALSPPTAVFEEYVITSADVDAIGVVPGTWLGKSEASSLPYTSMLELVAERGQAFQSLIRQLNPDVDWNTIQVGDRVIIPAVRMPRVDQRANLIRIKLGEKVLMALDDSGRLLAQFPCSIARRVEKRPEGVLRVKNFSESPNYRFDPEIFSESEEAQRIGRVLIIPEGPNNPVGTAWIGLDLPGYGIHGTPDPEKVGRTESHGCFRLANWNANHLVKLVRVGMPVFVEP